MNSLNILAIIAVVALVGAISIPSASAVISQSVSQSISQSTTQNPGGSVFTSQQQSISQSYCVFFTLSCG